MLHRWEFWVTIAALFSVFVRPFLIGFIGEAWRDFRRWRLAKAGPFIFTYREHVIGGFGGLVTERALTREERIAIAPAWLEILVAPKEPVDGERFVLVAGKLRRID